VSASQSISVHAMPRAFGVNPLVARSIPDATTTEGAFDQPYECANILVKHNTIELPIPIGYWRSVGHSHQAFFVESFIDEMATAARKDPLEFRLEMLKQPEHQRHAAVLHTLATFAGWRAPLTWTGKNGAKCARGIAMHESFGSVVAQVAEVEAQDCGFRVTRVFCVIDCGIAVNPNLVEQQMESGIIFGLSAALQQAITIKDGQVQQLYFNDFPLVTIGNCPEIDTKVLQLGDTPQGVGEAGTPPIAPAVANALFALTGYRHRKLPLLETPQPSPDGDPWSKSILTGKPLTSAPSPPPLCYGYSAAKKS
jgi:isoquinoline 1-oxidoreductase subunit beta